MSDSSDRNLSAEASRAKIRVRARFCADDLLRDAQIEHYYRRVTREAARSRKAWSLLERFPAANGYAANWVCGAKGLALLAVLLCAGGTAAARYTTVPPAAPSDAPSACQKRLAKLAEFQPLPAIVGVGECGAVDAVMLQSVILPDEVKVAVSPPATLRCTMAEEVARWRWLREDVAPATLKLGAALRGVDEAGSYECGSFNRVAGAPLSQHRRANALDVRALRLANGGVIGLTDVNVAKDWREGLRRSAYAHFTKLPGPGWTPTTRNTSISI